MDQFIFGALQGRLFEVNKDISNWEIALVEAALKWCFGVVLVLSYLLCEVWCPVSTKISRGKPDICIIWTLSTKILKYQTKKCLNFIAVTLETEGFLCEEVFMALYVF